MEAGKDLDLEQRVLKLSLQEAAGRAVTLSWVFAALFAVYGFTSFGFVRKFAPQAALWDNTWPRLLFSSFPFLCLGLLTKRLRISDNAKLLVWITGFSAILHATAWIYIWPIALHHSPEVLTYVHAANVYLFAIVFSIIAPPKRQLFAFVGILMAVFVLPLTWVAYHAGDSVIFNLVMNDSVTALGCSALLSLSIDRLRRQIFKLKLEKESEASKFLGPVLSKAIFEDEKQRLERVRCRGFVISMDVRNSTGLQQRFGERWLEFRQDYFRLVSQLVRKHEGYTQKTVGDCHVINFGIMDYGTDLSDIPGIENELERADDRRLQRASDSAFNFLEELFHEFATLSTRHFPNDPVYLGAGIDKGWMERAIQGDSSHAELDVNGDPVNCSNRLQEYSKVVAAEKRWESSVLVVSPYASDFLMDLSTFSKFQTTQHPVRNYPTLKWVLAKSYSAHAALAA